MIETKPLPTDNDTTEIFDAEVIDIGNEQITPAPRDIVDAEVIEGDTEDDPLTDREAYENLVRNGEYRQISRKGWSEDGKVISNRRFERRVKKLMKEYDRDFPQPRPERAGSRSIRKVARVAGQLAVRATEMMLTRARDLAKDTTEGTKTEIRVAKRLGAAAIRSVANASGDIFAATATRTIGPHEAQQARADAAYEAFWQTAKETHLRKLDDAKVAEQAAAEMNGHQPKR